MNVKVLRAGRLAGTALLVSLLASACGGGAPSAQLNPPAMLVQLQTVKSSSLLDTSEFVGALEAQAKVTLSPEVDGRVVQIFVKPGDVVKVGTLIAQLRSDKTQASASGAVADVNAARAALNTNSARVKAAEADRDSAAADVRLQESDLQRTQTLVSQGAQSRQTLDRARNSRDTAIAALRSAEADIQAAQAALAESSAEVDRSEADRAVAAEDLQDKRVLAPIAGVVGDIAMKVGDVVSSTTTLTSITQNNALDLNISVPIERSRELRVGIPVELLDEQNQPLLRGRISFVSPAVSTTNQAILAKATFVNDGSLRDGQLVRTRIIWNTKPGVLVPTVAVTRVAGQTFVYVAEQAKPAADPASAGDGAAADNAAADNAAAPAPADGQPPASQPQQIARQRPVTLGNIQGNQYQVISGVKAGEDVVVSGILNLSDGIPITVGQAVSEQP